MSNFKYLMIVTEEYEDNLSYYADKPWEGRLVDIVYGADVDHLWKKDNEGLFYQLYDSESGKRLGYGVLCYDSIKEDIDIFENNLLAEVGL